MEVTLERTEHISGKINGSGAKGKVPHTHKDAWQEAADVLNP